MNKRTRIYYFYFKNKQRVGSEYYYNAIKNILEYFNRFIPAITCTRQNVNGFIEFRCAHAHGMILIILDIKFQQA